MLIVTVLITILLITFFAKPLNATNFRLALGGTYGILFLIVWPYFRFYAEITALSRHIVTMGFVLLAVLAAGLIFLPIISKIGKLGATTLILLFSITIVFSFAFENQIKSKIGALSGYFSDENPISDTPLKHATKKFTSAAGGYTVTLPLAWQQQSVKPTGLPYFVLLDNGVKTAEFRPKCFHHLDVALPEMIQGIVTYAQSIGGLAVEKSCFTWRNNYYACLVKKADKKEQLAKLRWQWFGVNYDKQQGIELDFVIFDNSDPVIRDIESIIASLEPNPLPVPVPGCVGVAAWF